MAKFSRLAGSTSQSINVFIQNSGSTTGAGLTGLVYNTSGLTAYYTFTGANAGSTQIVLATLAAVNSSYSSGGFKEIDSTNQPGLYRLDVPNAAIASSKGNIVTIYLQGAANMAPCVAEIELEAVDNQSTGYGLVDVSSNVVQWGGSNIATPNVSGVPIVDIKYTLGTLSPAAAGYVAPDWAHLNAPTSTVNLSGTTVGTVTTVTNQLTAAAIATGVWQDSTSGDFTTSSSIGKSLYTSGVVPGGSGGLFIAGSNAGTTVNFTGNLSGSVGSVTAQVTANVTDWAGQATAVDANNLPKVDVEAIHGATLAAIQLALSAQSICSGVIGSGSTTTSYVTSSISNPSSLTDSGQLIGRTIIFLGISANSGHVQSQATNITSSTTGSTPTIGSTNALTSAPSSGDVFVVL